LIYIFFTSHTIAPTEVHHQITHNMELEPAPFDWGHWM